MRLEEELRRHFDMTLYEARAYLTLLGKRSVKPKVLAELSGVPFPRVYDTLSSLRAKGFAEDVGGFIRAVPPNLSLWNALIRFKADFESKQDERRKAMQNVLKRFRGLQPSSETDIVLLKGLNSIVSRLIEVVADSAELFFVIRKALKVKPLFRSALTGSGLSGKIVRVLLPEETRLDKEDISLIKDLEIQIRFARSTLLDLLVGGRRYVMIGVPEQAQQEAFSAIAVWIKNASFAESLLDSLNDQWRVAKPLAAHQP